MSTQFIRAIISNNEDPDKQGKVKVNYPTLFNANGFESDWARSSTPWGSSENGTWLIPNVGDEAIVCIEDNDFSSPIIIGFLHNKSNPPPSESNGKTQDFMILENKKNIVMVDDQKIDITNSSKTAINLESDKIKLGTSSVEILDMTMKFCEAILNGQGQFISTAMGPGALNPELVKALNEVKQKLGKIKG